MSPPHARKVTPNYAQGVTLSFVVDSSGIDILWRHGSHNLGLMYLVGHAIVAFLIAFGVSKKFKVGGVSFALVMLIACLPDIDILLQSAGIAAHKTYTHSLILSLVVVPAVIFAIARWRKVSAGAAAIYSLAYVSHIAIGDIAVGAINILYPFGNAMVGSGIGYGTVAHSALEFLLLVAAAAVIMNRSFRRQPDTVLFRYNSTDRVGYVLLAASLIISTAYLLYGIKILPRFFIETNLELALFVLLHLSAIVLVSFTILVARQYSGLNKSTISSRS